MADSGIGTLDEIFNRQYSGEKVRKRLEEERKEEKKRKEAEAKKRQEEAKKYPLGVSSLGGEKPTWRPTNIAQSLDHISNVFNKGKDSPNGLFDSEQSNDSGYGNFDEEPKNESKDSNASRNSQMPIIEMQTDEPSDEKGSPSDTKSTTPNVGNSTPKSEGTSGNNPNLGTPRKSTSGGTSPRRNTSRGEYADLPNSGKTKAWYESLANSSYANDKAYEADMKAYRKMQADEIAKNGYYTDSQGVKVYAKAMTDKPKKENNNE